ncbi:MAG: hypothetical protein A2284_06185 [Deltaproteobacteria bacterium RIFOXYA12_FULL_61_11]|nr:MAG: hypothetical protein A2284_06185 [Deltaproteobacteria bacterium RIFOXYA12_FULL_61_11]
MKKPQRILLIDDEQDILLYLSTALEDQGYEVACATSHVEGLRALKDFSPDLVCLDILMPEKTGLSLYRKLHSLPPGQQPPVIVISGMGLRGKSGNTPANISGVELTHYLEKPVNLPELIDLVGTLLSEAKP